MPVTGLLRVSLAASFPSLRRTRCAARGRVARAARLARADHGRPRSRRYPTAHARRGASAASGEDARPPEGVVWGWFSRPQPRVRLAGHASLSHFPCLALVWRSYRGGQKSVCSCETRVYSYAITIYYCIIPFSTGTTVNRLLPAPCLFCKMSLLLLLSGRGRGTCWVTLSLTTRENWPAQPPGPRVSELSLRLWWACFPTAHTVLSGLRVHSGLPSLTELFQETGIPPASSD